MKRIVRFSFFLIVVICFLSTLTIWQPVSVNASQSIKQLQIFHVFVDFESKTITIEGENFDNGVEPVVTLGYTQLNIDTHSHSTIEIQPLVSLPTGDYLMTVSTGTSSTRFDTYNLTVGTVGPTGVIGPEGPEGLKGDTGETGVVGPQGLKGDKGDIGVTGPQGLKGDRGDIGVTGPQGLKGDKGDIGVTGPQGLKGDRGDIGPIGFPGPPGVKGDKGDIGETGPKGDTGDTGPVGPVAGNNKQLVYNDNESAAGANVYYDKTNGNVGIGTTNPLNKLSVQGGNISVRVTSETGWKGAIYFQEAYLESMGIFYEGSASNNALHIGRADGYIRHLTVQENGYVGIGTTTPSYKLHVNGTVASPNFHNLSSRDYKEDIQVVDESEQPLMLAKLMDMDLTRYKYKEEYGGEGTTSLGFIAEDMPKEVLSKDGKGVDLYELLTFTIGAMKAQQKQIEILKHQINELINK